MRNSPKILNLDLVPPYVSDLGSRNQKEVGKIIKEKMAEILSDSDFDDVILLEIKIQKQSDDYYNIEYEFEHEPCGSVG